MLASTAQLAQFEEIKADDLDSPKTQQEGMSPKSADIDYVQESNSPEQSDMRRTNSQGLSNAESSSMGSSSNNSAEQGNDESPKSEQRCSFDINSMFNNNNEKSASPLEQLSQQLGITMSNSSDFSPCSFSSSSLGLAGSPASFGGVETNALFQLGQLLGQQNQPVSSAENIFNFNGLDQKRQQNNRNIGSKNGADDKKRSYPYTFQFCVLCNKNVHSSKLPCHIRQCHVSKPMFQCPSCDFTSTYSKNNVKSHMVSLHGLAGEPISYMDQYAGQVEEYMKKCFPNVRGRGRPVHDRTSPRNNPAQQASMAAQAALQNQKMHLNGGPVRQTGRQQRHKPSPINGIGMGNNKINEMCIQMLQGNKGTVEKNNCLPQMNPLAYFQSLGYFNQMMGQTPYLNRFNPFEQKKESEVSQPKNEQITMEQLLQEFSTFIPQNENQKSFIENSSTTSSSSSAVPPDSKEDSMDTVVVQGTHETPKYLSNLLKIATLTKHQTKSTVFANIQENGDILEQVDVASLSNLESHVLLTPEQSQRISEVRLNLQLQAFEVLFAIHRLDLDVLPLSKVNLVLSIAPTEVDSKRFSAFEQKNQRNLSEEEDFVFQLSRVERLRERLTLMQFIGGFESLLKKLNQRISDLQNASQFLVNSSEFRLLLQLILAILNVANGNQSLDLIHGFRTSKLPEMCNQKLSNGQSLMESLVYMVNKNVPEIRNFANGNDLIDGAANIEVSGLEKLMKILERGRALVETELKVGTQTDNLTEFALKVESEVINFKEKMTQLTDNLARTLEFFGESSALSPEFPDFSTKVQTFFKQIARFCRNFQSSLMSI
ncbi:unnamed protein product [Bursaphelenchus xylophilus]|uniref:(pine wood nematode) hypothetical protein n=1 Tax=Bursaphelenchus xylophilus TaxID=6326 RepID=A0A1I7S064_BURXY|nr:unnamed protein product [Bursaphelenchus xylophilus]CAG9108986.1 unnamed protein product [Bursaphelenchus xylophilus]